MNETRSANAGDAVIDLDPELQTKLDSLIRGQNDQDEFLDELTRLLQASPNCAWNIAAVIHQRYRAGEISADLFREITSKIVGYELASAVSYGTTIDLRPPAAKRWVTPKQIPTSLSSVKVGCVLRDRYVLEKQLGSGGMGTVFKALDRFRCGLPISSQYIAIKILHDKTDNQAELLANLRREFYCTQMLSQQNIVKVYELDRDGDIDFFTMELLEGELLSSVMARLQQQPMYHPYAWAIIQEIGIGLAHAHARNVVHADLKPHNIMITNFGEVRILDFGASSILTKQDPENVLHRRDTLSAVTPAYASCEILSGRPPDPRDDIYALSCIGYELLAGTHPFQRRPATVARDLAIVPKRPPGLKRHQWKTLETGLSWHRGGRNMTVSAWLNKSNAKRASTSLPNVRDLKPTTANHETVTPLRTTALLCVLLISFTIWALSAHLEPSDNNAVSAVVDNTTFIKPAGAESHDDGVNVKPSANSLAIEASADSEKNSDSAAMPAMANTQSNTTIATSHDVDAGVRPLVSPAVMQLSTETAPFHLASDMIDLNSLIAKNSKPNAAHTKSAAGGNLNPIIISAKNYKILPGEHFAEIRVYRSQLRGNTPFVWWTEQASARPGIDYVNQAKVLQSFPEGKSSTSFFIKLIPQTLRTQRQMFYIAIAQAERGALSHQIARAAIWLPTTRNPS